MGWVPDGHAQDKRLRFNGPMRIFRKGAIMKKSILVLAAVAALGTGGAFAQAAGASSEAGPVYNYYDYLRNQHANSPTPDYPYGVTYPHAYGVPYAVLPNGAVIAQPRYSNRIYDRDRDGIADAQDRDRDGDGVRNSRDRYPNDPRYR
jgi:hypothetical protein